jgi:hypothetical protein
MNRDIPGGRRKKGWGNQKDDSGDKVEDNSLIPGTNPQSAREPNVVIDKKLPRWA